MIQRLVGIKSQDDGAVHPLLGVGHVRGTEEVGDEADQGTDVEVVHVVVVADPERNVVDLAIVIAIVNDHPKKQR